MKDKPRQPWPSGLVNKFFKEPTPPMPAISPFCRRMLSFFTKNELFDILQKIAGKDDEPESLPKHSLSHQSLTKFEESVKVEEILKTAIKLELIAREQKTKFTTSFYKNNNIEQTNAEAFAVVREVVLGEVKRRYGVVKSSEAFVETFTPKISEEELFARFSKIICKNNIIEDIDELRQKASDERERAKVR